MQTNSSEKRLFAATLLIVGAVCAPTVPAMAAESPVPCAAASSPRPAKKGPGLGGLFGAVKRAGVGNLLGSGIIGEGARAADTARTAAELARSLETICNAKQAAQRGLATIGKPQQ